MAPYFVLICVAVTSAAACLVAVRVVRCALSDLNVALAHACECIGFSALFLIANIAFQVIAVFAMRFLTSLFVSLYMVGDTTLIAFSVLQGVIFRCWCERMAIVGRQ